MSKLTFASLIAILTVTLASAQTVDLAIRHASVFDARTTRVIPDRTILVTSGIITSVTDSKRPPIAKTVIDAKNKLVTPGLIDIHTHLTSVLGDYDQAPLRIDPDSVASYRKHHAETYLPFGITTVRIVGEPEQWIPMTLGWQLHPDPNSPDVYTCGAALVSREENRKTYINHVVVDNPAAASAKVQEYSNLGIRDIKLYWRLRYPEFTAALNKALSLHMTVCAHIDKVVTTRDSVLSLGLKDLEHIHPYAIEIISKDSFQSVQDSATKYFASSKGGFFGYEMELWQKVGRDNPKMLHSLQLIKKSQASLTPTIHIFGQAAGLSYIRTPLLMENGGLNTEDFTAEQRARCRKGYQIMASYVKKAFDIGVQLNLGTDCPDGGKADLSELLLLNQLGIPMRNVFQIGTINSAKAIGRSSLYGSIEKGKKADLIIFEESPLNQASNLLGPKIIIKDGIRQ